MSFIDFYRGKPNVDGLSLHDIRQFSDHEYDANHRFIQWVFPSDEPSSANPTAPVVAPHQAEAFCRRYKLLQVRLLHSYQQFLKFIGIGSTPTSTLYIENYGKFHMRVERPNHNLQRITRVLRSLHILGLTQHAQTFHDFLMTHRDSINPVTIKYWNAILS